MCREKTFFFATKTGIGARSTISGARCIRFRFQGCLMPEFYERSCNNESGARLVPHFREKGKKSIWSKRQPSPLSESTHQDSSLHQCCSIRSLAACYRRKKLIICSPIFIVVWGTHSLNSEVESDTCRCRRSSSACSLLTSILNKSMGAPRIRIQEGTRIQGGSVGTTNRCPCNNEHVEYERLL